MASGRAAGGRQEGGLLAFALEATDLVRQVEVAADQGVLLRPAAAAVEQGGQLVEPLLGEVAQLPPQDVVGVAVGDGVDGVAGGEVAVEDDAAGYGRGGEGRQQSEVDGEEASHGVR